MCWPSFFFRKKKEKSGSYPWGMLSLHKPRHAAGAGGFALAAPHREWGVSHHSAATVVHSLSRRSPFLLCFLKE